MIEYIARRLLAMIPTLFGITLVVFVIINLAPGSPIEQKIQQIRFGQGGAGGDHGGQAFGQRTSQAVSEEVIESLKKQYGFDKPLLVRYVIWLRNLSRFDFGRSFSYEEPVMTVVARKLPVSIQFGVLSFILAYLISVPLGVLKSIRKDTLFDRVSSGALYATHSMPSFVLAILLIVFFAGGTFFNWFPIGGIVSDGYEDLTFWAKLGDRVKHFFLPLTCYTIGQFATLTVLMKNSMLDELGREYVRTARSKGLSEAVVTMKHAFRNALIPIATGFGSILSVFFAGSILIESIFNLDGMGLLGYQSVLARDYNVIMGLLVVESALFLLGNLLSDLLYIAIDPRIDFR